MKHLSLIALSTCIWITTPCLAERTQFMASELTQAEMHGVTDELRASPVRALLLTRTESVRWDETPLTEVVAWLNRRSTDRGRVNVIVRWNTLRAEGIDGETPVTLDMVDTTVGEVLDEVLEQLSDVDPLTYIGVGNTLKIATHSFVNRRLYVRVYNIDEVFNGIAHFRDAPELDLSQPVQGAGGGGPGQVASVFTNSGGGGQGQPTDEDEEKERAEEIMNWLRTTAEPQSWSVNGGRGSIYILNRMLTVRNTLSVHEIVAGRFALHE